MMLITGKTAPMNDKATTAGGYLASKMHKETLPALLTDLEEAIGAEYIITFRNMCPDTNAWNSTGSLHHTAAFTKLKLFSLYDFECRDNIHSWDSYLDKQTSPYALFRLPLANGLITNIFNNFGTWVQEPLDSPTLYNTHFIIYSMSGIWGYRCK